MTSAKKTSNIVAIGTDFGKNQTSKSQASQSWSDLDPSKKCLTKTNKSGQSCSFNSFNCTPKSSVSSKPEMVKCKPKASSTKLVITNGLMSKSNKHKLLDNNIARNEDPVKKARKTKDGQSFSISSLLNDYTQTTFKICIMHLFFIGQALLLLSLSLSLPIPSVILPL